MWLVVTELESSTDTAPENFSGMSSIALSHLHFLSQHKKNPPAVPQIGYLLVPLDSYTCCSFGLEFLLLACLVNSSSFPKLSPGFTSSLTPSLISPLPSALMRVGHLSFSAASVLAYCCGWAQPYCDGSRACPFHSGRQYGMVV